jgi:hypothetical protein
LALFSYLAVAASLVLLYLNRSRIDSVGTAGLSNIVSALTVGTLGAIVASRRPRNPIGWLLLALNVQQALGSLATQLAVHGLIDGSSPHGWVRWPAWIGFWITQPGLGLAGLLFLLFPDGKLPSPRWRWLVWASVAFAVLYTVGTALDPTPTLLANGLPRVANPVGVPAFRGFIDSPIFMAGLLVLLLSVVSLVLRFRRSAGQERLQLKWFAFAATATLGCLVAGAVIGGISPTLGLLSDVLWFGGLILGFGVAIPGAAAIAILRYRLYDIDRVINRTLVYGALTLVLGGLYAGLALGLGAVAGRSNSVVIAGSTLVVAAMFRPLRRRIQAFIDRRFYRRRYDANRTLDGFSGLLRQEVQLDALRGHLVSVVQDTMQPAEVSLWLRPPAQGVP